MATEHKNQRICRIPISKDEDFYKTIPAEGSIYFRNFGKSIIVGNGQTYGGTEFVNKDYVINAISEANWKAQTEADKIKVDSNVQSVIPTPRYAYSELNISYIDINVYSTVTVE